MGCRQPLARKLNQQWAIARRLLEQLTPPAAGSRSKLPTSKDKRHPRQQDRRLVYSKKCKQLVVALTTAKMGHRSPTWCQLFSMRRELAGRQTHPACP